MNNVSIKEFKDAIDTMLNGYIDGVSYIKLGKTDDDKTIAIVIGWQDGYNDGEKWQKIKVKNVQTSGVSFVECAKKANLTLVVLDKF